MTTRKGHTSNRDLQGDAPSPQHIKQRHFIESPIRCAHRRIARRREGATDEAIPALLLSRGVAVVGVGIVGCMNCRDKPIEAREDGLGSRDYRLGRIQGLLFQGHQLNEHVAAKQRTEIIVPLLMMEKVGWERCGPVQRPLIYKGLFSMQFH